MCMCDIKDVTNVCGGLDGWDEEWVLLDHMLGVEL